MITPIKHRKKYILNKEQYQQSNRKQEYIYQKIMLVLSQSGLDISSITIDDLNGIFDSMKLQLTEKQSHQVYIYSLSYFKSQHKSTKSHHLINTNKIKINQIDNRNYGNKRTGEIDLIVNKGKGKLDTMKIAKWVNLKLEQDQITIAQYTSMQNTKIKSKEPEQFSGRVMKTRRQTCGIELPVISSKPEVRFQTGIRKAIDIFDQMKKQRQENGIVPISIQQSENEQVYEDSKSPDALQYDPTLHEVNKKIYHLKIQAERCLTEVVDAAVHDKNLRIRLQKALDKYQSQRVGSVEKIGRFGAMKAHKRMINRQKQHLEKIKVIRKKINLTQMP